MKTRQYWYMDRKTPMEQNRKSRKTPHIEGHLIHQKSDTRVQWETDKPTI